MPSPQISPAATRTRPVTSSAWRLSTRDDVRAARLVSDGLRSTTRPRQVGFRRAGARDEVPDRDRDPDPDRDRDREAEVPWRVVTVATNLSAATPATVATAVPHHL